MNDKSCSDPFVKELEKKIKQLIEKNQNIVKENVRLKRTLQEYGIEEISDMTDVEIICIQEIKKLKELSEFSSLTQDDAKTLDILHKNLRMARGEIVKKEPKGNKASISDLLKIVENDSE
jgi:hypothetical protein